MKEITQNFDKMPRLNEQQQKVLDYAEDNGLLSSREAYDILKEYYLFNHAKYVDEVLDKLVRNKMLYKTGAGQYMSSKKYLEEQNKQKSLFAL